MVLQANRFGNVVALPSANHGQLRSDLLSAKESAEERRDGPTVAKLDRVAGRLERLSTLDARGVRRAAG